MENYHKETFSRIPAEKQQRILDTAVAEFAANGFPGANINIIAKIEDIITVLIDRANTDNIVQLTRNKPASIKRNPIIAGSRQYDRPLTGSKSYCVFQDKVQAISRITEDAITKNAQT